MLVASLACFATEHRQIFTTRGDVFRDRVRYTNSFDWFMVCLLAFLVAHNVNKELRETRMCWTIARDAFFAMSQSSQRQAWGWLIFLTEVVHLRQLCLLPLVISTVPMFCLGIGMDSLTLALNAMAVLVRAHISPVLRCMHHSNAPSDVPRRGAAASTSGRQSRMPARSYCQAHHPSRYTPCCLSCQPGSLCTALPCDGLVCFCPAA